MIEGKLGYYFHRLTTSQNCIQEKRTIIRHILKWIFVFSAALQIVLIFSIFFWDYYAGQLTAGFGIEGERYLGIGNFYIYVIS
ncbi:MAG: hypothetical protein ACFFAJ_15860, partial [Candidatus Hodarchaeota archaeon]